MKKIITILSFVIFLLFFFGTTSAVFGGIILPERCTTGNTQSCTTSQSCPGTQTCIDGEWGTCNDISGDNCPIVIPNCSEGIISSQCYCGGTVYSSGYCCSGSYQTIPCGAQCTTGQTQSCTTSQSCPGTQTCVNYLWGTCNDTPNDNCPVPQPSLSIQWSDQIPANKVIGTYATGQLILLPKAYCVNGPCTDLQLTAEYCLGSSCSSYQRICDGTRESCSTEPVSVKLYVPSPSNGQSNPCLNAIYSGSYYYCWWNVQAIPYSLYYGQTIGLKAKASASNAATTYSNRVEYYVDSPAEVSLNLPSSQITIETGEILAIKWTTSNDLEGDDQRSVIYYNNSLADDGYGCDPTLDNPNQPIYYNTRTIYDSGSVQAQGTYQYNWTVPNITPGEYCIFVETYNIANAYSELQKINIIAPPSPEPAISAEIVFPKDENNFFIGSTINFDSNILCENTPCTIRWDSNADLGWYSNQEDFLYSGLSIGDHNITLTITDSTSAIQKDSVVIHINPITTDVLSISDFELIKIEPANRFAVNGKIRIRARVNYYLNEALSGKAFIIISDSVTHKAIYGPEPYYFSFTMPAYEEYDLNIDLSNYGFIERQNYKVEFLAVSNEVESTGEYFVDPIDPDSAYWDDGEPYNIPEQLPEQNKANNSGYQIIELGPATLGDLTQLPETNNTVILLILFSVLIIIKK